MLSLANPLEFALQDTFTRVLYFIWGGSFCCCYCSATGMFEMSCTFFESNESQEKNVSGSRDEENVRIEHFNQSVTETIGFCTPMLSCWKAHGTALTHTHTHTQKR